MRLFSATTMTATPIAGICDATGLANDGNVTDAASLNALDDWQELHGSLSG